MIVLEDKSNWFLSGFVWVDWNGFYLVQNKIPVLIWIFFFPVEIM